MRLHTYVRQTFIACLLLALFTACSSTKPAESPSNSAQSAKQAEAKPSQFETGREAFQKMYLAARLWAPDVKPFRLQSQYTPGDPVEEGKAGIWRASFASPSKRAMKMFLWSGLAGPNMPPQGVTFSAEDTWSPTNSSTRIFELAFLKTDSDHAYEVAKAHGGEKLLKKDPHQPVFFMLDWNATGNALLWHVIYGTSLDDAKLSIVIDATSGQFVRVEK